MAGTSKRSQHDDTTDGATQDAKTAADEQTPAGEMPQPVHATTSGDEGRTTVRLPFVTASFTRSSTSSSTSSSGDNRGGLPNPLSALAGAGHAVTSAVASTPPQKLLFYTGVAALGVVGVVEWPVAALVATGTYVASRSRGRGTAANHGVTGTTDAADSGHRPLTSPTEP